MSLLIGEVEHEEVMYAIGAPTTQEGLLPGLLNYYKGSVAEALMKHYTGKHPDVETMYTGIVTDVQVRATTRNFAKALVDGGVPIRDIYRYRISLPIKAEDDKLLGPHAEKFKGKVVHAFDFLHWWYDTHRDHGNSRYTKRVGFTPEEDSAIREWLKPFAQFVKGEEVAWGTENIAQFRHLTEDARVEVVEDSYWSRLMDTAAVLRQSLSLNVG